MSGKNINFNASKIRKSYFYKKKIIYNIEDIDAKKILVFKKEAYGSKNSFKYFLGYNDNDVIRPLCVKLSPMTGYARKFKENTTMSFRANNKQLLKNYNKIWKKIEHLININFENKFIKTKIKIYAGSTITNFHKNQIPKEKPPSKCLSIIMLDSVIKGNKKYYPQILLEKCKHVQEKIKTENYIDEDLEKSGSDSDSSNETESDIDNDDEYDE